MWSQTNESAKDFYRRSSGLWADKVGSRRRTPGSRHFRLETQFDKCRVRQKTYQKNGDCTEKKLWKITFKIQSPCRERFLSYILTGTWPFVRITPAPFVSAYAMAVSNLLHGTGLLSQRYFSHGRPPHTSLLIDPDKAVGSAQIELSIHIGGPPPVLPVIRYIWLSRYRDDAINVCYAGRRTRRQTTLRFHPFKTAKKVFSTGKPTYFSNYSRFESTNFYKFTTLFCGFPRSTLLTAKHVAIDNARSLNRIRDRALFRGIGGNRNIARSPNDIVMEHNSLTAVLFDIGT